jgi:hypothetical protein
MTSQSPVSRGAEDITDVFHEQFFFGCEAYDPLNALAFDSRFLPDGVRLNAMFASDIGHWDVPDMRMVVPEARALIETGLIDVSDFERFMWGNVVDMLLATNPSFFDGTSVASAVGARISHSSP